MLLEMRSWKGNRPLEDDEMLKRSEGGTRGRRRELDGWKTQEDFAGGDEEM